MFAIKDKHAYPKYLEVSQIFFFAVRGRYKNRKWNTYFFSTFIIKHHKNINVLDQKVKFHPTSVRKK